MVKDRIYGLLENIVGSGNVSKDEYTLLCYSRDSTANEPSLPDYVVIATTVEQIQRIVRLANLERIPIVPVVGMTNNEGLTIPTEGGIILDLHKMNKIIEINEDMNYAIVEPGVTIGQIDAELKKRGFVVSLPVGPPGSAGLLPGYILHGYGHLGAKYGINSEQITGMEVVLPDGEIVRLGGCAISPYWFHRTPLPDLMGLILGWQGTTGIVTKLGINIYPRPKFMDIVAWGVFTPHEQPLTEGCARLLIQVARADVAYDISGHDWGAIQIGLGEKFPLPPKPEERPEMIFSARTYGFSEDELDLKRRILRKLVKKGMEEGLPIDFMEVPKRHKIEAPTRYSLRYSDHRMGGGLDYVGSITPIIKWPEGIKGFNEVFDKYNFTPYIRLSVYRGSHYGMMRALMPYNRGDPKEVEIVRKMSRELLRVVLDCGGLMYKAPPWAYEMMYRRGDPNFLRLLRKIKQTMDPNRIMNPGKVGL